MSERTLWTDERLDDVVAHINMRFDQVDARFDRVDARFERVDERFDRLEGRIDARFDRLEDRYAASQRQFAMIGWSIAGVVTAQLIAGIVTAVIALS